MHRSREAKGSCTFASQGERCIALLVGGRPFSLEITALHKFLPFDSVQVIEPVEEFVCGLVAWNGKSVPVIDLGARFGQGATAVTRRTCVVVIELALASGGLTLGVMADSVGSVIALPAKAKRSSFTARHRSSRSASFPSRHGSGVAWARMSARHCTLPRLSR